MKDGRHIKIEFSTWEYTTSWETVARMKLSENQEKKMDALFYSVREQVKAILFGVEGILDGTP